MDSPSPPADFDSASKLFAALDLIGAKKPNNPNMGMDDMDIDLVLEIPDTPDRLMAAREADRPPGLRRRGCGSRDAAGGGGSTEHDINHFFQQASLARKLSASLDGKPSCSETQAAGTGFTLSTANSRRKSGGVGGSNAQTGEDEIIDLSDSVDRSQGAGFDDFVDLSSQISPLSSSYHTRSNGLRGGDKGKGLDLNSDPEVAQSGLLQPDESRRNMGKKRLVRNGCMSLCNAAKRNASAQIDGRTAADSTEILSSLSRFGNQRKGKVIESPIDVQSEMAQVRISQLPDDPPPRNTRQRRLVRNGCISPLNIAKHAIAGKTKDGVGRNGFEEVPGLLPSRLIQIVSPDAGGSRADKKKGKFMLSSDSADGSQDGKANSVRLTSEKDLTLTGYGNGNSFVRSEDSDWRSTHNHAGSNQSRGGSSSDLGSQNKKHHDLQKQLKGKRNWNAPCLTVGESSSLRLEDPGNPNFKSVGQFSLNSTKNRNSQQDRGMLGPLIEVDELPSPEVSSRYTEEQGLRTTDDSSARARQVELDEMLARRLQEEFYHESPGVGITEEIDANIALSLQQEDAECAAALLTRGPSLSRDASTSRSYAAPFPRLSFRSSSARSSGRARNSARNRMHQLHRNLARQEMDLEMRLDFWEAMEAAFDMADDMPIPNHGLQVQRDFNENDYETLLFLDENNHQHTGATDRQINNLPQSVIQSDNNVEDCAVCLETPSVGDVVRHLPCLHKFHKECIDTWLKRKPSCPICKSGIT